MLARTLPFLVLVAACDGDRTGDSAADTGGDPSSDWDALDWVFLSEEGDAIGDCDSSDSECTTDLAHLALATDGERLYVEVGFGAEPPGAATLEVFLFPADGSLSGASVRYQEEALRFWEAECEATKHEGCHWYEDSPPSSFTWEWIEPDRFGLSAALDDLPLGSQEALKTGVGAAPGDIQVTADFTDRHPDALWVTSQEVQGLGEVEISLP